MRKTYLYGAMALGLLFTACKSDDITVPDPAKVAEADQTFYVAMRISGDIPGTRGSIDDGTPEDTNTDFENGVENESKISNAYFVFYDMNGRMVGDIVPTELDGLVEENTGATVEKYYRSVVPVSIRKGELIPIQVICYINPVTPNALQNPLNVIQTITRDQVWAGDDNKNPLFCMSNSVYYPFNVDVNGNVLETVNDVPQLAVPIPSELLYESESKAEAAADSNDDTQCVNIYVERYASKLKFTQPKEEDISVYKAGTRIYKVADNQVTWENKTVELTFEPERWALNAEATQTYVIKSFRQESEEGQIMADNYGYQALNKRLNPTMGYNEDTGLVQWNYNTPLDGNNTWNWNNPAFHRSYWAVSPAYFQSEYPEVSSDLAAMKEQNKTINQKYLTYTEISRTNNPLGFAATNTNPQYFKETTVGTKALGSTNPAAATPSVIFVGHYNLKVGDDDVILPNITVDGKSQQAGFYTYMTGEVEGLKEDRPYIFFDNKTNSLTSAAQNAAGNAVGESMLKRFLAQATIIYHVGTDAEGNNTYTRYSFRNSDDEKVLQQYFQVKEISQAVKDLAVAQDNAGTTENNRVLKLQANARSLQIVPVADYLPEDIWIATANGYKQVVLNSVTPSADQITVDQANVALMQQVGYAYYYFAGKGYFNIPVKHLGWYRKGNAQKDNNKIDWKQVRVGDFGLVRNHSYSINVESIEGLASGIGGPDVPIVPPAATDDYWVAYTVRILKWAVVPTQSAKL